MPDLRSNVDCSPGVEPALSLLNVSRSFGRGSRRIVALRNLTLCVPRGQIVCLLGPNGAGKSTTVKIASTLLLPDEGEVRVCGIDAIACPKRAREHFALVLGGERGFYLRASAWDNLMFFALLQDVPIRERAREATEALQAVGLSDVARRRVETFSRGMRQRLHIARALMSHADLILLDEPTSGLDPQNACSVRELVAKLRDNGAGILLTTHVMREAEQLADSMAIIDGGAVRARGSIDQLADMVHVSGVCTYVCEEAGEHAIELLERQPSVRSVDLITKAERTYVDVSWDERRPDDFCVGSLGWKKMGERPATLEEIYLALLARDHEEAKT